MRTLILLLALSSCAKTRALPILVPDAQNLQYLDFWVALGARYFEDEGLSIQVRTPQAPNEVTQLLHPDLPELAILPPPVYLQLIADDVPIRIIGNLLQNDPIDLIVRRSVFDERKLSSQAPLVERLTALRGLRIGVAPGPIARLRTLFRSVGIDLDQWMTVVILTGHEQNQAFAEHRVDVLYAHTPFLERALVEQDAVMLVNQSGGEVPSLAARQIHALVATRSFVERDPAVLMALSRALIRAARLIHRDPRAAEAAVLRAVAGTQPKLVRQMITLYAPAIPDVPAVSAEGLRSSLALFPASKRAPDLSHTNLSAFVEPRFVEAARQRQFLQ
jgi:NitT/TauT family transport system substrate-binding protein